MQKWCVRMYFDTIKERISPLIALKIILLTLVTSASADWTVVMRQVGCDTSCDVNDVFFIKKTSAQAGRAGGWAAGENGLFMRLTNSGMWRVEESGVRNNLNGLFFLDSLNGWVVGDRGMILHTTDGGKSWMRQMLNGNSTAAKTSLASTPTYYDINLFAVYFTSESEGWAVGKDRDVGLILHTVDVGEHWQKMAIGYPATLDDVVFIESKGWVVGDDGLILHTNNAGSVWLPQRSNTSEHLHSVNFITPLIGWAVGDNGTILATNDGGISWRPQQAPGFENLYDVHFINPQEGYIAGASGIILYTRDGGQLWEIQDTGTDVAFRTLAILKSEYLANDIWTKRENGWALGEKGSVYQLSPSGNWSAYRGAPDIWFNTIFFAGDSPGAIAPPHTQVWGYGVGRTETALHGWLAGSHGAILHTNDGGASWMQQISGVGDWLNDAYFVSKQSGWVVGENGLILHTDDAGETWNIQASGVTNWLTSVEFLDGRHGWAVGRGGIVLYTKDAGQSWHDVSHIIRYQDVYKDFHRIYFFDEMNGWLIGRTVYQGMPSGIVLFTNNGGFTWRSTQGVNWSRNSDDVLPPLWDVAFIDKFRGFVVGEEGTILQTLNGGRSWHRRPGPTKKHLQSICFDGMGKGWIVGQDGIILESEDNGESWNIQRSNAKNHLKRIVTSRSNVWATGYGGVLLKLENPLSLDVAQLSKQQPAFEDSTNVVHRYNLQTTGFAPRATDTTDPKIVQRSDISSNQVGRPPVSAHPDILSIPERGSQKNTSPQYKIETKAEGRVITVKENPDSKFHDIGQNNESNLKKKQQDSAEARQRGREIEKNPSASRPSPSAFRLPPHDGIKSIFGKSNETIEEPAIRFQLVDIPKKAKLYKPVTIEVAVTNMGGYARRGGISISFPNAQDVRILDFDTTLAKVYRRGNKIFSKTIQGKIRAQYLLAEAWQESWDKRETHWVKIEIIPKRQGPLRVYLRTTLEMDEPARKIITEPDTGVHDQQGFHVKEYLIQVL